MYPLDHPLNLLLLIEFVGAQTGLGVRLAMTCSFNLLVSPTSFEIELNLKCICNKKEQELVDS